MSNKNDGGPAFGTYEQCGQVVAIGGGMSLREYFAAKASDLDIERILIDTSVTVKPVSNGGPPTYLKRTMTRTAARYAHADAMLAEREK